MDYFSTRSTLYATVAVVVNANNISKDEDLQKPGYIVSSTVAAAAIGASVPGLFKSVEDGILDLIQSSPIRLSDVGEIRWRN